MSDPDCVFYCGQILKGQLDVPVYCENEHVFAFHHTNPLWEQHVVLLPRRHIESLITLEESDNELLLELMRTARVRRGFHGPLRGLPCVHQPGRLPVLQAPPLAYRLRPAAAALLIL
jgi:hypothetical protein